MLILYWDIKLPICIYCQNIKFIYKFRSANRTGRQRVQITRNVSPMNSNIFAFNTNIVINCEILVHQ